MNRTPMSQSYVNSQAGGGQSQSQPQQAAGSTSTPGGGSGGGGGQQQQQQQQQQQLIIGTGGGDSQMSQLMCATELTNLLLEFAFSVFVNKPQDIVEYAANYFNQLRNQRAGAGGPNQIQQLQQQQPSTADQPAAVGGGGGQQQQHHHQSSKRASSDSQRSNLSQNSFTNNDTAAPNSSNNNNNNNNSIHQSEDDEFDYETTATTTTNRLVNFNQQQQQNYSNQLQAADQQQFIKPKACYNRRKSVFAEQYDPAADQEDDENNRVTHSKTDEQRQRLAMAIESIFLFRSVDQQDMSNLLDAMFEVRVSPGDVVIRQGDDGDNFYVVERGKFQIYVQQDDGTRQVRGEYENKGFFGELALMYNQPRAATVVALSEGSLWAMDRKTFRRIVLKSAFKKRKEYEALFEKVSILSCLNNYERMNLCDALESKRFKNGCEIIQQGDQANGMYFIESGNVRIVKRFEDGKDKEIVTLGKGDYFGELALINHERRAASVYALGDDVKVAFLDTKAFERLLGSCIERMEKNSAKYLSELSKIEGRQNV